MTKVCVPRVGRCVFSHFTPGLDEFLWGEGSTSVWKVGGLKEMWKEQVNNITIRVGNGEFVGADAGKDLGDGGFFPNAS